MKKVIFKKGFTLIELLVVITIIALLTAIVLASLNDARIKARDTRRLQDMKTLQNAMALYQSDHNGNIPVGMEGGASQPNFITSLVSGKYLPQGVTDPLNTNVGSYYYSYVSSSNGSCPATDQRGYIQFKLEKMTTTSYPICGGVSYYCVCF